jgi:hypothetical protein
LFRNKAKYLVFLISIILSFAVKATPVPLKPTVQNPMKHVEVSALKLLAWLCSDIGIPQHSQKFAGGVGHLVVCMLVTILWLVGCWWPFVYLDVGGHSLVGWMLVLFGCLGVCCHLFVWTLVATLWLAGCW